MKKQFVMTSLIVLSLAAVAGSAQATALPGGILPQYSVRITGDWSKAPVSFDRSNYSLTAFVPYPSRGHWSRQDRYRSPWLLALAGSSVPGDQSPWASRQERYPETRNSVPGGGYTVVPEPTSVILVGLGLAGVVLSRRRLR